ncbi:redoxin family protein [Armatimonas sp.]|uniref:redoxin family protein n=1 Tax=Armatimonas sp. TaxID=1872638 RepID=UPI00286A0EA3|nr:redoxin family protein [Armatimonas sp.]
MINPLTLAKGKKALVVFFVATDCPISNAYAPEIKRLCEHYTRQKIAFALVYPDPDTSLADAQKHAKAYGYTCPIFLDPGHRFTRKVGATVTPEVAVLRPNGSLLYRGRIDNLYVDFGKPRFAATHHDLRNALDATVANKTIRTQLTKAIGCFIPERK